MTYTSSVTHSPPAGIPNRRHISPTKLCTSRLRQHTAAKPVAKSPCICSSATGSAAQPAPDGSEAQGVPDAAFTGTPETDTRQKASQQPSKSILQRVKRFFVGDKMDMQRLKALGLGAVASYGCVSNVTYGTGLSISWISFVRQTGGLLVRFCHAAFTGDLRMHCQNSLHLVCRQVPSHGQSMEAISCIVRWLLGSSEFHPPLAFQFSYSHVACV